jgi:COP9 signalosome complex subunit 4
MEAKLNEILLHANNRDDLALKATMDGFVQQFPENLQDLVNKIMSDEFSSQAARAALSQFATAIKFLESEAFVTIANFTLSKIKNSANNFDDANFTLRDALFSVYLQWGQYSEAAQSLASLNVESTTRPYSDNEKADIFVKCAEAFLADDASVDAEVFVNKARVPMEGVTEWTLKLRYKVVLARILDANRKFTEAAKQYYELSTLNHQDLNQDDLLELYVKAITCNILGKTGPQRTRNLGLLFKVLI